MKILILSIAIFLSACSTTVPQFQLGEEVSPPFGCVQARDSGHDC
jgi:hypothetical protein